MLPEDCRTVIHQLSGLGVHEPLISFLLGLLLANEGLQVFLQGFVHGLQNPLDHLVLGIILGPGLGEADLRQDLVDALGLSCGQRVRGSLHGLTQLIGNGHKVRRGGFASHHVQTVLQGLNCLGELRLLVLESGILARPQSCGIVHLDLVVLDALHEPLKGCAKCSELTLLRRDLTSQLPNLRPGILNVLGFPCGSLLTPASVTVIHLLLGLLIGNDLSPHLPNEVNHP
mmetsp:Transcript_48144/g.104762  ORF Transcript_48144/g.104762 Transcript_48144/m.104762 type:complete len:229 (-) Transcript_48144:149-835(-)